MAEVVFSCTMCGICCMGQGGIVLGPRDMERICTFLDIDAATFMERYGCMHNGKAKIRTGKDGNCIFFVAGKGCSVHLGKPDVCRAWPYFRGNMVDAVSFEMAKDYCPGIRKNATHAEFLEEGRVYLQTNNLKAQDGRCEGNALLPVETVGT